LAGISGGGINVCVGSLCSHLINERHKYSHTGVNAENVHRGNAENTNSIFDFQSLLTVDLTTTACNLPYLVNDPTPNEKASVRAVIRMEMAASASALPIRCSTGLARFVRRRAATIRNILSVPTAENKTRDFDHPGDGDFTEADKTQLIKALSTRCFFSIEGILLIKTSS
jgi:hypothetical protein